MNFCGLEYVDGGGTCLGKEQSEECMPQVQRTIPQNASRQEAMKAIATEGAELATKSPVLKHVNAAIPNLEFAPVPTCAF
jgi:hypothetical protein